MSLARSGLLVFAVGWLLMTAVALFEFYAARGPFERMDKARTATSAAALADRVSSRLEYIQATLAGLAGDPALAHALTSGDASQRSLQVARLKRVFPSALRIRLLPPVDKLSSDGGDLSYAALDMLQQAARGKAPAEVDFPGQRAQRVNLVQAVRSEAGDRVAGNVMVSFPVALVHDLLQGAGVGNGYLELRQVPGNGPR